MPKLKRIDYETARLQYWSILETMDNKKSFPPFRQFVGTRPYSTHWEMNVNDQTIRRIQLLQSPHAKTLLQAWLIQEETK